MASDTLILSRLEFGFALAYHILWPTLSIGLAGFVLVMNASWMRTGRRVYRDIADFWTRIFALGFGMGVVTGVVISYTIGMNWSVYVSETANVLGPLFTLEVLTAFFLEAGFIGVMLFGRERVGDKFYLFACSMVALGTVLSAFWILAANSWMQTPAGFTRDANGQFFVAHWFDVIFNPSFPYRLVHMLLASYVTGCFVVIGVSALQLLRGRGGEFARTALSASLWLATIVVPLQIAAGDAQGLNTRAHQPIKLAAIEGRWETGRRVPLTLFALPDQEHQTNHYAIEVPVLGSLILTHSLDGEVRGLKTVPPSEQPPVIPVFFAFRIMVGVGLSLFGLVALGGWLRWRKRLFDTRLFLMACVATIPLGFVATLAGWTVTEVGRQPYVVYGLLRTADAVSPLAPSAVGSLLVTLLILYNLLLLGFLLIAGRMAWTGPAVASWAAAE